MKKGHTAGKIVSSILVFLMTFAAIAGTGIPAFAKDGKGIVRSYGDYVFSKVSNPSAGSGEADGINTNDITGYSANRLNSYAWAVASRGDSIYIGTNRTLFGSALNAVAETIQAQNPKMTPELMGKVVKLISGGQVPVNLPEEEYIPQIIRFDVGKGSTEVIYRPGTAAGDDGRLYYTDRDGAIVPNSDVASEAASFRSVVEFNGNLYFGSLGTNMLQLVRVDEKDNSEVVFQTIGVFSSLRAACTYDAGDGETIYFGGQDATNADWRRYRMEHPDEKAPLPIVIRYLDPQTAGSSQENWDGLVADFTDFGEYAYASVYSQGGGNVWDLCSFNGKLYLILAFDEGWAMFRGEKGGASPNKFGWTWTEVVGNQGKYPLAMNAEIAELNQKYEKAYGCSEFNPALHGAGLLESTATPYVYNGKMYIGTFDNGTLLQSQTVIKAVVKLKALKDAWKTGNFGPSLSQFFAPFYEALSHPQHVWVMDETETIAPVEGANALLDGTANDYVWRFIEYEGKLYAGTFDSSTAYNYFLDYTWDRLVSLLKKNQSEMPAFVQQLLDGTLTMNLRSELKNTNAPEEVIASGKKAGVISNESADAVDVKQLDALCAEYKTAAVNAATDAEALFANGDTDNVEKLIDDMTKLESVRTELEETTGDIDLEEISDDAENGLICEIFGKVEDMIDSLCKFLDLKGLCYWAKARKLVRHAERGFDVFVTDDGQNWSKITGDGLGDLFNYGARTFTICNGKLYLGTANPYYGAQLWQIFTPAAVIEDPQAVQNLVYKGSAQKLVIPGKARGGSFVYALGKNGEAEPELGWSSEIPVATNAGTYTVFYKVKGDAGHLDVPGGSINVTIGKADITGITKPKAKSLTFNGSAQQLVTAAKCDGRTIAYSLDNKTFTKTVPTAKNAGKYTVFWKVSGDANYKDTIGTPVSVTINKANAVIKVKTTSKAYKAAVLKQQAKTFSIGASVNSKGQLLFKAVKYKNAASKKCLQLNTKNGTITVKKGTPKGTYAIKVKVYAKATANFKSTTKKQTIKVTVK